MFLLLEKDVLAIKEKNKLVYHPTPIWKSKKMKPATFYQATCTFQAVLVVDRLAE